MNYKGTQNDDDDGDDNDDGNNNNNNHETKQLFCYDNIKKKKVSIQTEMIILFCLVC